MDLEESFRVRFRDRATIEEAQDGFEDGSRYLDLMFVLSSAKVNLEGTILLSDSERVIHSP